MQPGTNLWTKLLLYLDSRQQSAACRARSASAGRPCDDCTCTQRPQLHAAACHARRLAPQKKQILHFKNLD
ncbi:hypothetical protein PC118_g23839 [Phytophthora cactorum]|uniref:Uncharacterized protein n=1 Tax=Phytophthora cactorum TaxID=29920 RepID=A0A8T1ENN1_9STRA|nr:hypothetical protein PC118_g23839 [Phytophthora cactorum]